uniref:Alpha-galactosidase n=1 Tax=Sphingomonas sp. JB13 TaxID=1163478 RepID=M4GRS1_9SPHN|nr:alpha-galactosidase precursor [Sphingomonas sp. JB13]
MVMRRWGAALAAATMLAAAPAHASAGYDAKTRMFRLDGGGTTYAFGVTDDGYLQAAYWGGRLGADDPIRLTKAQGLSGFDLVNSILPQEFPGQGAGLYTEPALKVAWPDGNRDLVLKYVSHKMSRDHVEIVLKDIERPLFVTLDYSIDPDTGVVGRSARIENRSDTDVRIDQAEAGALTLPVAHDYRLHYLTGRWAAEWTLQDRPLTPGATVLESRRGSTGSENNPWFAITRDHDAGEEYGPVWFGALAWSGSWRITVDQDPAGEVRVVGGFNPFDFAYRLKPGESLDTPTFYAGYSDHGMGGASRLLHRFERDTILPHDADGKLPLRPVLYNSWEATGFDVDEAGQIALAEKAAKIGVERFVMDDGWFGARNDDHAGLGDWTVNRTKFPNGLKPLIDKVHGLGMQFGLWVEPEMTNPDSDLYRAHPDWVMNYTGRPRTEGRNQLVLNLARTDVRDYIFKVLDDLLDENDIQFLKWDYNRNWSEPGWPEADVADQQQIYVKYVRNLYWIIDKLRARHPKLEIESCSGGGGRVDLGIMSRTDEVWPSDNTDPFDRLTIQNGFTYAYPPAAMMAWVTASPNWVNNRATSLDYRFLSAMQGGLGIGADLNKWSDAEFAEASRMVAAYKRVRATVQQGDLYRLIIPNGIDRDDRVANLSVSPDKQQAVLFAFLHSSQELDRLSAIRLRGLAPKKNYRVARIDGRPLADDTPAKASGAYWMARGIDVPLIGDFDAAGYIFQAI